MSDNNIWNRNIAGFKVALLYMAIENEISCRKAEEQYKALYRVVGETLRQCLILLEKSLDGVPGYTQQIPDNP